MPRNTKTLAFHFRITFVAQSSLNNWRSAWKRDTLADNIHKSGQECIFLREISTGTLVENVSTFSTHRYVHHVHTIRRSSDQNSCISRSDLHLRCCIRDRRFVHRLYSWQSSRLYIHLTSQSVASAVEGATSTKETERPFVYNSGKAFCVCCVMFDRNESSGYV